MSAPSSVRTARRIGMSIVAVVIAWTIGATAIGVFRGVGWISTDDPTLLPAEMTAEDSP